MTSTLPRQSRAHVVRTIASTLCFSDPPIMKNLTKAREAATGIYDALVAAGVIVGDADDEDHAAGDGLSLFAGNGAVTPDVDAATPADPAKS